MRYVTVSYEGVQHIGVMHDDAVILLRPAVARYLAATGDPQAEAIAAVRVPTDMAQFVSAGPPGWDLAAAAVRPLTDRPRARARGIIVAKRRIRWLAPITPSLILCGGANFADHLDETRREIPAAVECFLKTPLAVVGPGGEVIVDPRLSHKLDYEVEVGVVIGKAVRNVPRERALEAVFGYTVVNDISARDRQIIPYDTKDGARRFQIRFGEGKNYDTGFPIGPWIVSADEVPDPSNLRLQTRVNDELRQNNTTRNLLWDIPGLIAYYSTIMTLQPGMLIATGTPGGPALGSDKGLGANPYERADGVTRGRYLQPGDYVRCEVEGVGHLENDVRQEAGSHARARTKLR